MKLRTSVKAGGSKYQHNETMAAAPPETASNRLHGSRTMKIKTNVKAGKTSDISFVHKVDKASPVL